jgi:hypothetical protein
VNGCTGVGEYSPQNADCGIIVSSYNNVTIVKNPGTEDMQIIIKQGETVEIQKITNETVKGVGKKLGTTYLLPNGEVVYVVENR